MRTLFFQGEGCKAKGRFRFWRRGRRRAKLSERASNFPVPLPLCLRTGRYFSRCRLQERCVAYRLVNRRTTLLPLSDFPATHPPTHPPTHPRSPLPSRLRPTVFRLAMVRPTLGQGRKKAGEGEAFRQRPSRPTATFRSPSTPAAAEAGEGGGAGVEA